ncbi:MAG: Gfo/Idh/MocA family oxidoreductase [Victivallales bacterium]|nr:Gfo/Idh/MocA family oxidoreductase [Victivallales bacterium]
MNLKAGIVGCGKIAKAHIAGYQENGIEITALTDMNPQAAKTAAENLNGKAEIFTDAETLIKSGKVDLISICTPPAAHADTAVCALENGIHVLCEKPLAHTAEAAGKIRRAAEKSDAKFMVAFRHRFLPATQKMKAFIDCGKIGTPVLFLNEFCGPAFTMKDQWFCKKAIAGGGCMLDTGAHSVDLFRYLFGEIIEQHAVMHKYFENTDVEDCAILTVKAKNGTLGSLTSGFVVGGGRARVDITGQAGRLVYEYGDEIRYYNLAANTWENIEVKVNGGFGTEIGLFADAIKNDTTVPVGIEDGIRCLEIIQSNYK